MSLASSELAKYLSFAGLGPYGGQVPWSTYSESEPATPDEVVTLYVYGGEGPDTDEQDEYRANVQVRVRSASLDRAVEKQELIRDLLLGALPVVSPTAVFSVISGVSDIQRLMLDEKKRHVLVASYATRRSRRET